MRYFKIIVNGYIQCVGVGNLGQEIPESEYIRLKQIIQNKLGVSEEYTLKLRKDLIWEETKSEAREVETEVTQQEYNELINRLEKVEQQNIENSEQITETQIALCELYEQVI